MLLQQSVEQLAERVNISFSCPTKASFEKGRKMELKQKASIYVSLRVCERLCVGV